MIVCRSKTEENTIFGKDIFAIEVMTFILIGLHKELSLKAYNDMQLRHNEKIFSTTCKFSIQLMFLRLG